MLSLVQKEYKFLDVMKFMMAIVVVAIHTRPECSFESAIVRGIFEAVYSIAVPFFFMASGFLLFRKVSLPLDSEGEKRIKKYLKKIVKLYLIWTAIYLPLTMYGFYMDGMPLLKSIVVFIRNILLVGENYMSWPLWYLLALLVGVGIIYGLLRLRVSRNWIVIIGILMAMIGVALDYCKDNSIMQSITDLYFSAFQKTRNGFFVGFLYVSLGMLCSKLEKVSSGAILLILLVGLICMHMNIPLSVALVVFAVFTLSISSGNASCSSQVSISCRLMSPVIYFCHMLWMSLFLLFCDFVPRSLMFSLVAVASILMGLGLIGIKESRLVKLLFT